MTRNGQWLIHVCSGTLMKQVGLLPKGPILATFSVEYTGRVIQFTSTDANRTPVWLEPSEIQSFAPGPIQGTLIHMKNGETYSVLESAEDVSAQIPSK